jgi:hypothetical protein
MTPEEELALLRRKLAKRSKRAGFADNLPVIQARIAELEANA